MADTYRITSQEQMRVPGPTGSYIDVMRVHFTTTTGTNAYVDVPIDTYSAAVAKLAIDDFVSRINEVHAL